MKCPYCGKEMKSGAFVIQRGLDWIGDNREPGLLGWGMSRSGIQVPHNGQWLRSYHAPQIKAYHCPTCRKFIFDGKLNE